jgi:hypothetical protein
MTRNHGAQASLGREEARKMKDEIGRKEEIGGDDQLGEANREFASNNTLLTGIMR